MLLRKSVLIIALVIVALAVSGLVGAISDVDALQGDVEKLEEILGVVGDPDDATDFLKGEWAKFLAESKAGQLLVKIGTFMKKGDFVWVFLWGLKFSFTILFLLTFIIWVFMLDIVYAIFGFLDSFGVGILNYFEGRKGVISKIMQGLAWMGTRKWLYLALFVLLISWLRLPRFFATWAMEFFATQGNWVVKLISVLVGFGVLIFLSYYARKISFIFEEWKAIEELTGLKIKVEEVEEKAEEAKEEAKKEEKGDEGKGRLKELGEQAEEYFKQMKEFSDVKDDIDVEEVEKAIPEVSDKDVEFEDKKAPWWKFWKINE